jgi:hypothetical protein
MVIKYKIIRMSDKQQVDVLNSLEEVEQYIAHMQDQQPYEHFEVETINVSSVKPGFGRDPDLH